MPVSDPRELKLVFVKGPWAFFTTAPVDSIRGDDWDDAPYEHNAGLPNLSGGVPYELVKVAFDGDLETPADQHSNTPWSVEDINTRRMVPWLADTEGWILVRLNDHAAPACLHTGHNQEGEPIVAIFAGTTLEEFVTAVHRARGEVYTTQWAQRVGGSFKLAPLDAAESGQ